MHTYEIRVQGQLDQHRSAWFSGLAIAWSAFLIWRESKPVALVDSVA